MFERLLHQSIRRRWPLALGGLLIMGGAALAGSWLYPTLVTPSAQTAAPTVATSATPDTVGRKSIATPASRPQSTPAVSSRSGRAPQDNTGTSPARAPAQGSALVQAQAHATSEQPLKTMPEADHPAAADAKAADPATAAPPTTPNLSYQSSGYNTGDRQRIQSALHASNDVIHISNAGDEIVVSRDASAARAATRTGSDTAGGFNGGTSTDGVDESDPPAATRSQQPEMATANCPIDLPDGSTEEQAKGMTQSYGCKYMYTCRLSNDGNDQVLCRYAFVGMRS